MLDFFTSWAEARDGCSQRIVIREEQRADDFVSEQRREALAQKARKPVRDRVSDLDALLAR